MNAPCPRLGVVAFAILSCVCAAGRARGDATGPEEAARRLAPFFRPPAELANDLGKYRSPLLFDDGTPVRKAADWPRRRQELLRAWHGLMGPWPERLAKPRLV